MEEAQALGLAGWVAEGVLRPVEARYVCLSVYVYVYAHSCVCVCVCVYVRARVCVCVTCMPSLSVCLSGCLCVRA